MSRAQQQQPHNHSTQYSLQQRLLTFLYKNSFGIMLRHYATSPFISNLSGYYCNLGISKLHIKSFVKMYDINMNESSQSIDEFRTFNDFFSRTLKPTARSIDQNKHAIISPADGKISVIEKISATSSFKVKKSDFNLSTFLGSSELAEQYNYGTLILIRLDPWDYHRYHFPVDAVAQPTIRINGKYESVNPIAYQYKIQPLTENERHLTILHNTMYGDIAFIAIGALCVGKIIETYQPDIHYHKGDEIGYFEFGGSTIVLLFKPNTIIINPDIIQHQDTEFSIRMGQIIGYSNL